MNARARITSLLLVALVGFSMWWLRTQGVVDPIAENETRTDQVARLVESAERAIDDREFEHAAELIEQIGDDLIDLAAPRLFQLGVSLAEQGWFLPAEKCLTQAVRIAPDEYRYRLRLATVQYLTGRYEAALEHWAYLLRFGGLDLISMPALGNRELRWNYEDEALERGLAEEVNDPLLFLGLGHRALQQKNFDECAEWLRRSLELAPDSTSAQDHWGQYLYETGKTKELIEWLSRRDGSTNQSAEVWNLRGHIARESELFSEAIRCYWEAVQRDPMSYTANDQLANLLPSVERSEEAQVFRDRSEALRKYAEVCRLIHRAETPRERQFQVAAEHSRALGCLRESSGWCHAALAYYPTARWADEQRRLLSFKIDPAEGRVNPGLDLRKHFDFSDYPLPVNIESFSQTEVPQNQASLGLVRFQEVTEHAEIDFVFQDGADETTPDTLLFEFTGGGVAVLDYDCDGWPDLFFPQGGPPPLFGQSNTLSETSESRPADQLVRNTGVGRFVETTDLAGISDDNYSQGATVGDFNSDGFPDLYIANIGPNALFSNNGDGTFQRMGIPAFESQACWTTSCAMSDLNGDSHPDLYDVNYVVSENIHASMCKSGGASVPCDRSTVLAAEQDRLFLSTGDGDFRDLTEDVGIVAKDGIGLGIVVADFDRSGPMDIFVANDARANFLFVNRGSGDHARLFDEQALLCGVAYSGTGQAQACMGVAADDLNADGLLDLFVTNFYDEYNTLYQQRVGLIFEDKTKPAAIQSVSYRQLGFGSQFLDADLDGFPDLVYTNGDVVDFSPEDQNRPYRQHPQFLYNLAGRQFQELPASQLGGFFQQRVLGRGLVRLDWNRDGREDFAVSHIGSKAALVENTTDHPGHFLDLRLVGTESNRDAIGVVVTLETRTFHRTRQLIAGDGYMASNQRQLVFGLGAHSSFETLTLEWPSGRREKFNGGQADRSIVIVEGAGILYELPE